MSTENDFNRKFGHRESTKLGVERQIPKVSLLLKASKVQAATSVNLVINNPQFLIGGDQQPYDQGNLGSCTANALGFSIVFNFIKQNIKPFMPSRLDIYYQERYHFGGNSELMLDEGANISDCEYVLENVGVVPESIWKYVDDSTNSSYFTIPDIVKTNSRTLAVNKNTMYSVNQSDLSEIKMVLTNGYPLVCGMLVDPQIFCSTTVACTGVVSKIPNLKNKNLAGHAVVIVGYTSDGYFIIRNSWGINWGLGFFNQSTGTYNYDEYGGKMRGYFKVPFAYVTTRGIVSELYAVTKMGDTTSAIKNVPYFLLPSNDSTFAEEETIKPITTLYKSTTHDQLKLKVVLSYFRNDFNYYWVVSVFKLIPSGTYQLYGELTLNNMNYFDNKINFNIVQKSPSLVYVNIYRNNALASVVSIALPTLKLSLLSSYKLSQ